MPLEEQRSSHEDLKADPRRSSLDFVPVRDRPKVFVPDEALAGDPQDVAVSMLEAVHESIGVGCVMYRTLARRKRAGLSFEEVVQFERDPLWTAIGHWP